MLIVSVLFLSITSVTGQIARRSLEGKEKQIMYGDDNMDEAMDIDRSVKLFDRSWTLPSEGFFGFVSWLRG